MTLQVQATIEHWPLAQPFIISRGTKTTASVIVAEIHDGEFTGRGEGTPNIRYSQTVESELARLEGWLEQLRQGDAWPDIQAAATPGPALNALDCALWDLRAKREGQPIWALAGLPQPKALTTAFTISLDTPSRMAEAAAAAPPLNVLKLKLGGPAGEDLQRIKAIAAANPGRRLIVDANEAWSLDDLVSNIDAFAALGVELIEQPLPRDQDHDLTRLPKFQRPIPIGADESCHTRGDLPRCSELYDLINIKLDKTGGFTEALNLSRDARAQGLQTMVGCMLGTSLAMAPAHLIGQSCNFVDLDAPLLLREDRPQGLRYRNGMVEPASRQLWG